MCWNLILRLPNPDDYTLAITRSLRYGARPRRPRNPLLPPFSSLSWLTPTPSRWLTGIPHGPSHARRVLHSAGSTDCVALKEREGALMANSFGTDILIQAPDPTKAASFYVEQLG